MAEWRKTVTCCAALDKSSLTMQSLMVDTHLCAITRTDWVQIGKDLRSGGLWEHRLAHCVP